MDLIPTISTRDKSPREFYEQYLLSETWRSKRNRALSLSGWMCNRCGTKRGPFQVHHKTYERLGREWDQDLEVLCDGCHGDHHEREKTARVLSVGLYFQIGQSLLRKETIETISDFADALKSECARLKVPMDVETLQLAIRQIFHNQPLHISAPIGLPLNRTDFPSVIFSRREAEERCAEILAGNGLKSLPVRDMSWKPKGVDPSRVDIYAPVPRREVEHDRY